MYNNEGCAHGRVLPLLRRYSRGALGCNYRAHEDTNSREDSVLQCIYEEDFLGFSYGFRPQRSQHQALDALHVAITEKRVNWILDADVEGFFDNIDRDWLIKFIEHRVIPVPTSGITLDSEQEPYEGILHVRICAGAVGNGGPYRDLKPELRNYLCLLIYQLR